MLSETRAQRIRENSQKTPRGDDPHSIYRFSSHAAGRTCNQDIHLVSPGNEEAAQIVDVAFDATPYDRMNVLVDVQNLQCRTSL